MDYFSVEKEEGEGDMTNGFAWFLIGGVIGATVALLYAPKSGAELRSDIGSKADDLIAQAKMKADRLIRRGKMVAGSLREELDEARKDFASERHPSESMAP